MNGPGKSVIRVLSFLLFLMVCLNGFLFYQNYRMKNSDNAYEQISLKRDFWSNNNNLKTLDGKIVDIMDLVKTSNLNLFVFFSLSDCPACLTENSLWQKIHQETGINVIGIAEHLNEIELKGWVENTGLTFPVLYDKDRKFTNEIIGVTETPLKILVDNSAKIVLTDPVRIYKNEQEEFLRKLESYVK